MEFFFHFLQYWKYVLSMKTPRAYASAAVLPNGEFWITGGASRSSILKTTEILSVRNEEWTIRNGPKMPRALIGHCFAVMSENELVIAGGYSPIEDDYSQNVDIYDMGRGKWYTKPWIPMIKNGPRIDSSCINFLFGTERRVVIAGGWNNTAMEVTEYLDPNLQMWVTMGRNYSQGEPRQQVGFVL